MGPIRQEHLNAFNNDEQIIWKGGSSQLMNFKSFFVCFIVIAASIWASAHFDNRLALLPGLLALLFSIYKIMEVQASSYTLTNQRIIRRTGLFNRSTFEIELYRIKDVHLYEPLQLRIFSLGNISLISSQAATQAFELTAVKNAIEIREQLRYLVERRRGEKGVGEYDMN